MEQMKFVGHYLIIVIYLEKQFLMNKENLLNEALNRYFKSVKESHPNLIEREILEIAANLAIKEVEKKLGEGTKLINTNDGPISRVDHKWQQEKGSNISNDGFFKDGFDTVTLPKSIDTDTPEGNKAAGKIVDQLKDAKKRGEKMKVEQQNSDWENRKPQITVKKEEG